MLLSPTVPTGSPRGYWTFGQGPADTAGFAPAIRALPGGRPRSNDRGGDASGHRAGRPVGVRRRSPARRPVVPGNEFLQLLEALVECANSIGFGLLISSALVALAVSLVQPAAILIVGLGDPTIHRLETPGNIVRRARESQLDHTSVRHPRHSHRGVLARRLLEQFEPL